MVCYGMLQVLDDAAPREFCSIYWRCMFIVNLTFLHNHCTDFLCLRLKATKDRYHFTLISLKKIPNTDEHHQVLAMPDL